MLASIIYNYGKFCDDFKSTLKLGAYNDTADRIEAYAKKSGMKVVETIFNTDKKAVERLRYYIERDVIICVLVRDVVDISMELNEIKAVMTLAAEHGISINAESRGYEPALISYE